MRAVALVLLAFGCAHQPPPKPRSGPPPAGDELMQVLRKRHEALRTLELETRTTSWRGGDRIRATVLMLVERSGRFRFEAEIPLQGTVGSLVVTADRFFLLDLEHKVYRTGLPCPANVAQLVQIPLAPQEVAAILLGDAPLGAEARALEVGWDANRGADVLAIERAAAARLWITVRRPDEVLAVEGQSHGANGRWRVAYEGLERVGGIPLPSVTRFAEPGRSFDEGVEIKVKERIGVNRALQPEAFTLSPPPGYAIEHLPCLK